MAIALQYVVKRMNIVDDDIRKSAEVEVKSLCSLSHINIVKYVEWIQCNNDFFIVMEFCQGGDLADKITRQRTVVKANFSETKVIQWTVEMSRALQVANQIL